jgi:murein endopeptidase
MALDKGLWREINHEDIMKQAREFEELEKDNLSKTAVQKTLCPDYGHELVWIEQYQRWYCYGCHKYP